MHTEEPEFELYRPGAQLVQSLAPVVSPNLPAGHGLGGLGLGDDVHSLWPVLENRPAAQLMHEYDPTALENMPWAHEVQSVAPVIGLYLPAAQVEHVYLSFAPTTEEKCPEGQAEHAAGELAPATELKYP